MTGAAEIQCQTTTIGTSAALIDTAVRHYLQDTKPGHATLAHGTGAVLSPVQVQEGAAQIAAACTFSGHPYVLVTEDASGVVIPPYQVRGQGERYGVHPDNSSLHYHSVVV
jgi:hypothetical protein